MQRSQATLSARFWGRVTKGPGCWLWNGPPGSHGYGQAWDGGRVTTAHQLAWGLTNGPVPAGLELRHVCNTKLCVRPSANHVIPGTHQENMDDLVRAGGHPRRKLTMDDARSVRDLVKAGATQRALATEFGVSQRVVWSICNGLTYREL